MFNINWMGFQTQPECGFRRRQQDDTNVIGVSGLLSEKESEHEARFELGSV
ncbi:hypothetical protein QYZ41_21565 [Vibrio parahaemolyticus]|nr:hypothetical protein [Vibrio parahaemolyticus]